MEETQMLDLTKFLLQVVRFLSDYEGIIGERDSEDLFQKFEIVSYLEF